MAVARGMQNSHSLPFDKNPPYKAYLETAFALGIVAAGLDVRNLLSLYYLNLAAPSTAAAQMPGACQLFIMPWNTLQRFRAYGYLREIRPAFDLRHEDPQVMVEWVINTLADGGYVYATVNEYFIPGTRAHAAREPYTHPCLITACDAAQETFTAYSYLSDGTYGSTLVPYAVWAHAFTQRGDRSRMPDAHFHEPVLYGIAQSKTPFSLEVFDRLATARALANYVNCRFDKYETCEQEVYGTDAVGAFLERMAAAAGAGNALDLRGTRTLMEHRRIMTMTLEHAQGQSAMQRSDRIERAFKALETWASALHSLAYDYERKRASARGRCKDQRLLRHMRDADRMLRMDKRVTTELIGALEPRCGLASAQTLQRAVG